MSLINPHEVCEIFIDCLTDDTSTYKIVTGITKSVAFSPDKLDEHSLIIEGILHQLPKEFMKSGGGGTSFLQACIDKNGDQWTGLHITMEKLFLLGLGIGKVTCIFPKHVWESLPGGVPYYMVEG